MCDMDFQDSSAEPSPNLLLDLPFDLQEMLFIQYLGPVHTSRLRCACSSLRDLCQNDDIWKQFCCLELDLPQRDFPAPTSHSYQQGNHHPTNDLRNLYWKSDMNPVSYFLLYSQLIYPFRGFFNQLLWSAARPRGELISLAYESSLIVGYKWTTTKRDDVMQETKSQVDFVISLEGTSGKAHLGLPVYPYYVPLPKLSRQGLCEHKLELPFRSLQSRLLPELLDRIGHVLFQAAEVLQPNTNETPAPNPATDQGKVLYEKLADMGVRGDCFAEPRFNTILPKGLFKGTYGLHGIEILRVSPQQRPGHSAQVLTGTKLLGDPNVPAGADSWCFPLNQGVVLNSQQQDDIDGLEAMVNGPFVAEAVVGLQSQPFHIPPEMDHSTRFHASLVTSSCVARFVGWATIAEHGFENPQSTPAQLVVLSATRFVVLWLGVLQSASLFEKIAETDPISELI